MGFLVFTASGTHKYRSDFSKAYMEIVAKYALPY
jgi:hypothetical protein